MTFENLLIERDDAVAVVTFNRPKVLNALNTQTLTELSAAMAGFKADARRARDRADGRRREVVRRRRRHQRARRADADRGQGARAPRPADLRRDRTARQAGDRGGQRLRARWRLRAGDGVHDAPRRRHRAIRPARDQPRHHSRLRRQPAAAAPGRPRRGARDPADRRHDQRAARVRDRPRQSRRAGGGADEPKRRRSRTCSRRRRRSRCATSSKRCIRDSTARSRRASSSRRRCSARSPRRPT